MGNIGLTATRRGDPEHVAAVDDGTVGKATQTNGSWCPAVAGRRGFVEF